MVIKPLSGSIADRWGMKPTMLAGIAVFVLASLAYLVVDPRLLIVIRFLQGAGAAALSAVSAALVGAYSERNRGRAYGIYNSIKGAGYVVSPIVGGAIVLRSNFSMLFVASAGIGALAFVFSAFLPRPAGTPTIRRRSIISPTGILTVFRQSTLWPWYIVSVINMFFVGILFGFLPVRVYALGTVRSSAACC